MLLEVWGGRGGFRFTWRRQVLLWYFKKWVLDLKAGCGEVR